MATIKLNIAGQKFGRLSATKPVGKNHKGLILWEFVCDCGSKVVRPGTAIKSGQAISCGCAAKESQKTIHTTHGHSRKGQKSPEYKTWEAIFDRCYRKSQDSYALYGGKGVRVCERWQTANNGFENFFADMGSKPSKSHSIDRIDSAGDYTPENCRWATKKEQARNRKNNIVITTPKGDTKTLIEACEEYGLGYNMVKARVQKLGWSVEKALTTPHR